MLIVKVEGELELALKHFKNKVKKTRIMEQLKERKAYEKKSEKRRKTLLRAKYKQKSENE